METETVRTTLEAQRVFFATGATRDLAFRQAALLKLENAILAHEQRLTDALHQDFHKCAFEAYATEIGIVLAEIRFHRKRLRGWARPEKVAGGLVNFPSSNWIQREPYGVALIISPWNYPFQLLVNPLVGAISAGNCAILKPADYATHTGAAIAALIAETFPPEHVATLRGGRSLIQALLEERFDTIFFTGSPALGALVMEKAARHLTPVSLELGGKSPCIVERDANLAVAASRIAWGKFLNAGQTCVAPDYLLVQRSVKEPLVAQLRLAITRMYGEDPQRSPDFPRIINDKQMAHLQGMLLAGRVLAGGVVDEGRRYISPTLIDGVGPDDPIMQAEIFGPLLPILEYDTLDEAIAFVNARPKPLALYFFSGSRSSQEAVLARTSSGGACINDTVAHLANHHLPFGGVGGSGMGGYHGKYSFEAFSHRRAVLRKPTWLDIPIRYAPYADKLGLVKRILG
jgi:aldehyde dehydrogenase (NAD+)